MSAELNVISAIYITTKTCFRLSHWKIGVTQIMWEEMWWCDTFFYLKTYLQRTILIYLCVCVSHIIFVTRNYIPICSHLSSITISHMLYIGHNFNLVIYVNETSIWVYQTYFVHFVVLLVFMTCQDTINWVVVPLQ